MTEETAIPFTVASRFTEPRGFFVLLAGAALLLAGSAYRLRIHSMARRERVLERRVDEVLARVKVLSGLLPICASCKKIRDDQGYWQQLERYIHDHSEAEFTHGVCADCLDDYRRRRRSTPTTDTRPD